MKKGLIVGFCIFLANLCLAQKAGMESICLTYDISGTISQNEIDRFHEFVLDVYNKQGYSVHDTISFLDIYSVRLPDSVPFNCEIIQNGVFLDHLVPEHMSKRWFIWKKYGIKANVKHLLYSWTILFHKETPLMEFWMWEWPKLNEDDVSSDLLHIVQEYNIVSLYDLQGSSVQCLLGVNEKKNVFVIRIQYFNKKISVTPAKDFLDSEFPYLFPNENNYRESLWNCVSDTTDSYSLKQQLLPTRTRE